MVVDLTANVHGACEMSRPAYSRLRSAIAMALEPDNLPSSSDCLKERIKYRFGSDVLHLTNQYAFRR